VLMFGFGALIALGSIDFWPTFWLAVAGAIAGDGLSFWLGHHFKERLGGFWPFSRYPALFAKGETFFLRHGGKSILFGRFVGPVRPIIPATAGMLGMPGWKFLFVNTLSALAWAPAYLLPGMVFGASLSLAAEVASRLAVLLLGVAALLLLSLWLVKSIYRLLAPRAEALGERALAWGLRHPHMGRISAALFEHFTIGPPLARLDHSTYEMLQAMRTPWGDHLMLVLTQLGDGVVQTVVVITLGLWLAWRRYWLALGHWLAAAVFAAVATWILKQSLDLPRPVDLFEGVMSHSFPSAHTLISTSLYGLLSVLVARELPPHRRWLSYATAWLIILSIAFSRLYLGAHWLSDVVGGLLLGLVWAVALGVAYRRHLAPPIKLGGLILIPLLTLVGFGGWHVVDTHAQNLALYAPRHQVEQLSPAQWLTDGWRQQPAYRIDSRGFNTQPLSLQWAGTIETLRRHLEKRGWHTQPPLTLSSALQWLNPKANNQERPYPPRVHDGRPPALIMTLPEQNLVLHLWPSDTRLGETPLWLGFVGRQHLIRLPLITLPSLSEEFNIPMQQFKPFVATLHWQVKHRDITERRKQWRGEVLLLWSDDLSTRP
jgi:membrane protein DedA with SNARE-associated domain